MLLCSGHLCGEISFGHARPAKCEENLLDCSRMLLPLWRCTVPKARTDEATLLYQVQKEGQKTVEHQAVAGSPFPEEFLSSPKTSSSTFLREQQRRTKGKEGREKEGMRFARTDAEILSDLH